MLRNEKTRRQEMLENRIRAMAEKLLQECDYKVIAIELRDDIYTDGFEHCEPDLFTLISDMFKNDGRYSLDFLSLNMLELRDYIEKSSVADNSEFLCITKQIDKLCDYINLEIGRINYYLIDNNKIKDLERKVSDINISVNETQNKLKQMDRISGSVKEKVQNLQRDSITILGIFASIVLTFTGGMIFSSSVLENIGHASAYRVIIVALIIGLVVINSVISLIMYIGKIVRFKDESEKSIRNWISGNVYWISVNVVLFTLVILTYIGWLHSTEKELLDESNRYQIEMHHKNTEELRKTGYSASGNSIEE